jgi:hypothetical protein
VRKRFGLVVVAVLALDWAAVDDITTGHEPSLVLEWTFVALSLPLLWVLIVRLHKNRVRR